MTDVQFRSDVDVELIKHSASDHDVVWAARVSTKGARSREDLDGTVSTGLINFLTRERHGSPFEHSTFTFYVNAPIFVWREHMRHRIGFSYNEASGRYMELEPVFYMPDADRKLVQVGKPGRYEFVDGTEHQRREVIAELMSTARFAYEAYRSLLDNGVAREVARMVLPVSIYSQAYVTLNARSLMNFLSLRTKSPVSAYPSRPQREIEMVAEHYEAAFAELMPITYNAFDNNGRVAP